MLVTKEEGNVRHKRAKEERKYKKLRELGQDLHIPTFEAFLTLEVFDKNGKLIQKHHQRSHSWVRNAYNAIFSILAGKNLDDVAFGPGLLSMKCTTGDIADGEYPFASEEDVDAITYGLRAAAGEVLWGIAVGSGEDAESFEDYTLQTIIIDGAGGGQLNYSQSEAHDINYGALTLSNTLVRYFNNNSGGNVSVNEVVLGYRTMKPPPVHMGIFARDKLGATVTPPDTGQLKVTYTVQLIYPS